MKAFIGCGFLLFCGALFFCVVLGLFGVQPFAGSGRSPSASPSAGPALLRDAVDMDGAYGPVKSPPIHVGQTVKIAEAMTDAGWAQALTLARKVGNGSGVQSAYNRDSYRQYKPDVLCKVSDQPERSWSDGIECVVQSGGDTGAIVYATVIDE